MTVSLRALAGAWKLEACPEKTWYKPTRNFLLGQTFTCVREVRPRGTCWGTQTCMHLNISLMSADVGADVDDTVDDGDEADVGLRNVTTASAFSPT